MNCITKYNRPLKSGHISLQFFSVSGSEQFFLLEKSFVAHETNSISRKEKKLR